MSRMRKFVGFLMALAFAAFALPSTAAKLYSLDITLPGQVSGISLQTYTTLPVPQGTGAAVSVPASGGQVYATIVNQTPSGGNSAINSFTFTKPPGWTISAPVGPSGVTLDISTGNLKVSNIPSLLPKDQQGAHGITVGFTLTPASCGTGPLTWVPSPQYVTVYTGNFSATTFAFIKDSTTNTLTTNQTTAVSTCFFTVNGSTSAGGTVACSPTSVAYGQSSSCSVTINPGYTFTGFSPNCGAPSTATSCTVSNVTSTQTVTASFSQIPYAINGSTAPGGTVTCNPSSVTYGQSSICTAAINPGYTLTGFSANCGAPTTATSCTVSNVTSSQTVTATYSQIQYAVNGSSSAGGTVTCTPSSVTYGQSSTCSVSINPGYTLTGFSANCGAPSTATSCTVSNVTSSQTVTASFSQIPYAINGSTAAGGTVTCTPSSVTYGQSSLCTAVVNANYTLTGFSANCGAPATATSCTVSNVTSSQTVTATYTANNLAVTSSPSSAVVGTPFDVVIGSTPTGASVSFSAGCDASSTQVTQTDGSTKFTITINTLPAPPSTCTMTFTAPNYNPISLANLQVYKGTLYCGDYDSINGPSDVLYDPDLPSTLSGQGSSYVGAPGWGLRRGPNKDGAACVRVNYTCDMTANATTNVVTCTWDKNVVPTQLATFKYLFLWAPRPPDANGWTSYRPQVSWPPAVPDNTFAFPNWAPLVSCVSDLFSTPPTLILPKIPSTAPFTTDANNTLAQYQPGAVAYVCGGQQGWTAVGSPGASPGTGVQSIQIWNVIIDEADLKVSGP